MIQLTMPALPTPLERVSDPLLEPYGVELWIKRDDLTSSPIMGNKWRKLKHNLLEARTHNHDTLATFGGAYSNHIYATAAAGQLFGFKTFGFIRCLPAFPTLSLHRSTGSISTSSNDSGGAVLAMKCVR